MLLAEILLLLLLAEIHAVVVDVAGRELDVVAVVVGQDYSGCC